MLRMFVTALSIGAISISGVLGGFWSADPTLPPNTEDAECDWSTTGEMEQEDSSGTVDSGYANSGYDNSNYWATGYYPKTGYDSNGAAYTGGTNGYNTDTSTGYTGSNTGYSGTNTGYSGTNPGYTGNYGGYTGTNTGYSGTNPRYTGTNGYHQNSEGTYYGNTGTGYVPASTYGGGSTTSGDNTNPAHAAQRFFKRQVYYMDPTSLSGLHPKLPIGSYVSVTNPDLKRSVTVQIVGRPKDLAYGRCLTLSRAAFAQIAYLSDGVTHCIVKPTTTTS